jgi:hypothetical protein
MVGFVGVWWIDAVHVEEWVECWIRRREGLWGGGACGDQGEVLPRGKIGRVGET